MNCEKCNGTGVYETGNNDLPCSCTMGATAVFNVLTEDGLKSMTGAEFNAHLEAEIQRKAAPQRSAAK